MPGATPDFRCACDMANGYSGTFCELDCTLGSMIPDPTQPTRCKLCSEVSTYAVFQPAANSPTGKARCVCRAGYYQAPSLGCLPCPAGQVSANDGDACHICEEFPASPTAPTAPGRGTVPNDERTECIRCSATLGQWSIVSNGKCGCAPNTGLTTDATCRPCPAGCSNADAWGYCKNKTDGSLCT